MIFKETNLKGAYVIDPEFIEDDRGFFARAWCRQEFASTGLNDNLVQCNISFNKHCGTVRGMHFQRHPFEETKLVRCTKGEIFDAIIDLRKESPTYKKWFGIHLNENNRKMLYVPENFAHGYITLTDATEVFYQVSQSYTPAAEGGLRWNDPEFSIHWPITENVIVSDKDQSWPLF